MPSEGGGAPSGVNAPFGGTLFLGEPQVGRTLDLSSGSFERIPGVRWEDGLGGRNYPQALSFEAHPRPVTAEEFAVTVDACQLNSDADFSILDHCIALHDADGTELAVRLFELDTQLAALPSPDGEHIVTVMDDNLVVVLDRELELFSQGRADEAIIVWSLAWLSDEQFVYGSNYGIWLASITDPVGQRLLEVERDVLRQIKGVSVSPDSRRLAFSYGDDIHVTDVDTGVTIRLPLTDVFDFLSLRMPTWSPDGQWLAVKVEGAGLTWAGPRGEIKEGGGQNVFINDATIIVPYNFGQPGADGKPILDAHLISARTGVYRRDESNTEAPLDTMLDLDPEDKMWWLR